MPRDLESLEQWSLLDCNLPSFTFSGLDRRTSNNRMYCTWKSLGILVHRVRICRTAFGIFGDPLVCEQSKNSNQGQQTKIGPPSETPESHIPPVLNALGINRSIQKNVDYKVASIDSLGYCEMKNLRSYDANPHAHGRKHVGSTGRDSSTIGGRGHGWSNVYLFDHAFLGNLIWNVPMRGLDMVQKIWIRRPTLR